MAISNFYALFNYRVITKDIGGSLGFEELIVGLLIANLGYSFYINAKLSEHIGWHKGRDNNKKRR